MDDATRKHLIENGQFMTISEEGQKQLDGLAALGSLQNEKVEELAWVLFQRGTGLTFKKTLSDERKKEIAAHPAYQQYRDKAIQMLLKIEAKREKAKNHKKYPVIQVPASGKPDWGEGARCMFFVYSKNHGNFILEGYRGEVDKYLKNYYTHYFYYVSMWWKGQSRGHWKFWKENVGILEPSRSRKDWKYEVRLWTGGRHGVTVEESNATKLSFKRLPHRWIPEFDRF